jgi:hypothetical protein
LPQRPREGKPGRPEVEGGGCSTPCEGSRLHRAVRRVEQQVPIHPNTEAVTDWYFDRRLNLQVAACHFTSDLREIFTSVRWTGYFTPDAAGSFEVFADAPGDGDSGFRLYLDDKLVLDID